MTHFRKRLYARVLHQINEWIAVEAAKQVGDDQSDGGSKGGGTKAKRSTAKKKTDEEDPNQGRLILDVTYAPADIAYPTDLSLLNGKGCRS